MTTRELLDPKKPNPAWPLFVICVLLTVGLVVAAYFCQTGFGRLDVQNVYFTNSNGLTVRAKLLKLKEINETNPAPGIVYVHGYQSCRETSDPYCIELARRGFAVLEIDAIGRGNSDVAIDEKAPGFDPTYGAKTAFEYLKKLPFVKENDCGLMGHSIGAGIVYDMAQADPTVRALVITGFGFTDQATKTNPKNMLMIFGKWDDYRRRMTGLDHFETQFMQTDLVKQVIAAADPQFGKTYGNFEKGTARQVFMPYTIHVQEAHSEAAVAVAAVWMHQALGSDEAYWFDQNSQVWLLKEWCSLVAMILMFVSMALLGLALLRTSFFQELAGGIRGAYACTGKPFIKFSLINAVLIFLYIPLILIIFAVQLYGKVPISFAFPLMIATAIVWWFLIINIIGFLLFKGWFKKQKAAHNLNLSDLGLSVEKDKFVLDRKFVIKTILLGAIIFGFAYLVEYILENIFLIDYRFVFSFFNDLTPQRWLYFLIYFPFIFAGFLFNGIFLHAQMRPPQKEGWPAAFISTLVRNLLVMLVPMLIMLAIQYLPLFLFDVIPLEGPGGVLVNFIINLVHIAMVMVLIVPLSTWFYQLTGKVYLGALMNALLVTWMFAASQVAAPVPIAS